jgi:hypothetical protein
LRATSEEFVQSLVRKKLPADGAAYEDLFAAFTRNFGKGFVLGFAGRTLLNLFG